MAWWLLVVAACGDAEGGVEYRLSVEPLVPLNRQDLFREADRFVVRVRTDAGVEDYPLDDTAEGASPEVDGLGALDGATIELVGTDADGRVLAWGRSEPVTISSGEASVSLLVSPVDAFGWLAGLPEEELAGIAAAPDRRGGFLLFGGSPRSGTGTGDASDKVLRFSVVPPSDGLAFEEVATLPEADEGIRGRVGAVAVLLEGTHSDAGRFLVAGGSSAWRTCADATDQVLLFDPESGTFEELDRDGRLDSRRYMMRAAVDAAGNVVMAGGANSCSSGWPVGSNLVHVYRPAQRENTATSFSYDGAWPPWMPALARLGEQGTLLCGGVLFSADYSRLELSDRCHLVTLSGELEEDATALPEPAGWHEMTALPDGSVLVTGGLELDGSADYGERIPASDRAWVFDGSSWRDVGPMVQARAMHRSALLPDGRVLLVGGVAGTSDPYLMDGEEALACAEIYDPATETFEAVGDCDGGGSLEGLPSAVAHATVVSDEDLGVLVVGGIGPDDRPVADAAVLFAAGQAAP